jgi:hypothetical protein
MAVSSASESEMQAKFASIRKWQAISRAVTVITVVVVAVEFYLFYTTTRTKIESSFQDQAKVQEALQKVVPEVSPDVGAMLRRVTDEALPVYQKHAAEHYERLRNSLGTKAMVRMQQLPEDAAVIMKGKFDGMMKSALKKVEPEVVSAFPDMSDPAKREVFQAQLHDDIEAKNKEIAAKIDKIRVDEMGRVKSVLDRFALPPDEMAGNNEEKGKELIRTMLLLAQEHLETMEDSGLTVGATSSGKTPMATPSTRPASN